MTAKDILSSDISNAATPLRSVDSGMPVLEVLPRLLDTPRRMLGVTDREGQLGVIDQTSLLEGLGRMIAPRDDSSEIHVECTPAEYSASSLAHAIEDTDAHLVDLLTRPSDDGMINVTLRVRHTDPTAAVHSLERYGYKVVSARGASYNGATLAAERLLELQTFLNI